MYKIYPKKRYTLKINESVEGESIEQMMERLINNKEEEMVETKELLFTREQDGVIANFNIRHDHWDDAAENASTMAEKSQELDGARLKKRTDLLKKQQEEEKFLREHANEIKSKKDAEASENKE